MKRFKRAGEALCWLTLHSGAIALFGLAIVADGAVQVYRWNKRRRQA